MSTLTKEWLLKTIADLEEERDATSGAVNEDAAMALAAMKLALASLESGGEACEACGGNGSVDIDHGEMGIEHIECQKCYTSQPAPVSVPDGVLKILLPDAEKSEFWFEHDGKILFEGVKFNNAVFDACRAAMLQGGEQTNYRAIVERIAEIIHGKVTDIDLLTVTVKSMKDKLQN